MKESKKSVTLYDAGGLIIFITIFGIPFGSIFDYLWNLLVFSVALPFLPAKSKVIVSKRRSQCFKTRSPGVSLLLANFISSMTNNL